MQKGKETLTGRSELAGEVDQVFYKTAKGSRKSVPTRQCSEMYMCGEDSQCFLSLCRDGRVLGVLEVSRSIGDGQYKRCGVISVPDIKRCQLTHNDR